MKNINKAFVILIVLLGIAALIELVVMPLLVIIKITFSVDLCSKEKLEFINSPNEEYKVVTYRKNCGATTDFSVIGELCKKDNCIEIYDCYHEKDSNVYWVDNEKVSINNKILNINNEKYFWKKDKIYQEHLYKED